MEKLVGLILAKSNSLRLPSKNTLDFKGQPMFMVNLKKCLTVFDEVYVSSDDHEILLEAEREGAFGILRDDSLCGDIPNIPVYQHALEHMKGVAGIVAVQSCSPNIDRNLIAMVKKIMEMGAQEVMTVHPITRHVDYHKQHYNIYGSIWGIKSTLLQQYPNPYRPNPEVLLVDNSIDIHTKEDYEQALCQN